MAEAQENLRSLMRGLPPTPWESDREECDGGDGKYWNYVLLDGDGRRLLGAENADHMAIEMQQDDGRPYDAAALRLTQYLAAVSPDVVAGLLDETERLTKERDSAKAYGRKLARLMIRARDQLNLISALAEDEGGRVYFNSTNDADILRDLVEEMDGWKLHWLLDRTLDGPDLHAALEARIAERDAAITRAEHAESRANALPKCVEALEAAGHIDTATLLEFAAERLLLLPGPRSNKDFATLLKQRALICRSALSAAKGEE